MVVRFLADEDVPGSIVRGIRRLDPAVDILRVQDAGLRGATDLEILECAARDRRAVVSRDRATMRDAATKRIVAGKPMPGLLLLKRRWRSFRRSIIEDLVLVANCSEDTEWDWKIEYLPF